VGKLNLIRAKGKRSLAKQEFADGGFIGKLGQVIGQHWHNIRYVRTYAKPSNPRTEKQQANRKIFKTAIRLAQEAIKFTGHNDEWDTTNQSQFNAMTSQAKLDLQAGKDEFQAIPWHPHGWVGTHTIVFTSINWNLNQTFTANFTHDGIPQAYNMEGTMFGTVPFDYDPVDVVGDWGGEWQPTDKIITMNQIDNRYYKTGLIGIGGYGWYDTPEGDKSVIVGEQELYLIPPNKIRTELVFNRFYVTGTSLLHIVWNAPSSMARANRMRCDVWKIDYDYNLTLVSATKQQASTSTWEFIVDLGNEPDFYEGITAECYSINDTDDPTRFFVGTVQEYEF
jgi:hypothetical protein